MTTQASSKELLFDQFSLFVDEFCQDRPSQPVDGEYYDLPETVVYHTTTLKLGSGGRLEINRITPQAAQIFEWTIEITLNHKQDGIFIHVILREDKSVDETYGKNVIPVDNERAKYILDSLRVACKQG